MALHYFARETDECRIKKPTHHIFFLGVGFSSDKVKDSDEKIPSAQEITHAHQTHHHSFPMDLVLGLIVTSSNHYLFAQITARKI